MAKSFARAVLDFIAADISDLSGRVWYGEAPANTGLPVCVATYAVEKEERTTGADAIQAGTLKLSITGVEAASPAALGERVANLLKRPQTWPLVIAPNLRVIHLLLARHELAPEMQRLDTGQQVYTVEVPFNTMIQITIR